jgi:hypothetical protein
LLLSERAEFAFVQDAARERQQLQCFLLIQHTAFSKKRKTTSIYKRKLKQQKSGVFHFFRS